MLTTYLKKFNKTYLLVFVLVCVLDVIVSLVISNGEFHVSELFSRMLAYSVAIAEIPLVIAAKKANLDEDTTIIYFLCSLVGCAFLLSLLKGSISLLLLGGPIVNPYEQWTTICITMVALLASIILLVRTINKMIRHKK